MTREEKINLLNELLEYEEKNDIGLLTRAERREFQQWISEALEQETVSKESYDHEYFLRKELEVKIDKLERQFDEIRTEIEHDYEQDKIAREVFRDEKKAVRAEQCTGSISAYRNVLGIIDKARGRR